MRIPSAMANGPLITARHLNRRLSEAAAATTRRTRGHRTRNTEYGNIYRLFMHSADRIRLSLPPFLHSGSAPVSASILSPFYWPHFCSHFVSFCLSHTQHTHPAKDEAIKVCNVGGSLSMGRLTGQDWVTRRKITPYDTSIDSGSDSSTLSRHFPSTYFIVRPFLGLKEYM